MTVHILSGPVGSGKTTYARQLEDGGAVRFSIDEWMIRLYGQHMPDDLRQERQARCRRLFLDMTEDIGAVGVDVVLDCGFWKRSERQEARDRLTRAGLVVQTVYFDLSPDERWRRLVARNGELSRDCYRITRPMFDAFESVFEAPGKDELVRVVRGP
jgi:predicted kinase